MSKQLADIGKRLTPSLPKDALLKLLKQAATLLTEIEQSPSQSTVAAMKPCTEALVRPDLLRHKDKDVRLLVATCVSEIMRIVAPEAPYEDDVLKDIFQLIVAIFQGLNEVSSPSFSRRVNILETVAKVRSCVVMLDLECDDLILEMFHAFFNTASENHPQNVFVAMRNILALVIKESEEISQPLLEAVLNNILKDNKDVSPAAYKLAVAVVERCADKLEPYVQKFLTSIMLEGKRAESELQEDYHDIIYEIYACAPQMLLAVIPNLTQELVTDQIDVRLKAVELLGRLFALPGRHVAQEYKQLFAEFLKRFSDKAVEVRLAVVECAKACLEANPLGPEAQDILVGLDDRLLDYDDKVRMSVVKCLCDLVNVNSKWVPIPMIKRVAERLRDKKFSVREDTLHKLADVYRTYTAKCKDGLTAIDEQFEWIPSKIVRCCFDKDFRPQSIEIVFTDELFHAKVPLEQRAKHWIAMFTAFDKNDEKAFRNILGQKQRLQVEMQSYLGIRKKSKEEDSPDLQKKMQASFKSIAASFPDSSKAEENLQKLHQMKDNGIFKLLSVILDTSTEFKMALSTRDELMKRVGEKHPQYDFINTLATKCSFLLFNKEHVKAVLSDLTTNKEPVNKEQVAASLSLLVEFAAFFPALLEGTEGDLLELLKTGDEAIKEGVVHVLAKVGGVIQIAEKESSVDLTLEKLCLEGNRKQAKHAVSAISSIAADSGLKALSVLYGRLVDLLEDKLHLPTILQSLGCIAQNAIPVFETREEEVVRFVVRNLLKRETVLREGRKSDWNSPSEECLLKIYGVKSLVKSFLPHKDAQLRSAKLKGLLGVVAKLLTSGEVSDDINSSAVDRAHLRLAAGKGVLRLARRWDSQISPNVFHSTLMLAHDPFVEVKQKFLAKLSQYLKERVLHQKYGSAFALVAVDQSREIMTDGRRSLAEFVESSRREARSKQVSVSSQMEGTNITSHPEYVLTYLVHVLAHQPKFPSEASAELAAYEPSYRQLSAYLRALVRQDGDGRGDPGKKEDMDNLPAILAIFRTIKTAEDLVDKECSQKLYTLCDIGIVITKELGKKKHFSGEYPGSIALPAAFYNAIEVAEGEEVPVKADGSHLPACFTGSDVFTRLRAIGGTTRAGQPSSPRGSKRDRRTLDGDFSSDEGEKTEESDRHAKKTRHIDSIDETGANAGKKDADKASAPPTNQSRGRRKANGDAHKNGIVKVGKGQKKEEIEDSLKRKRGRPKGSGIKASVPGDVAEDSASKSRKQEESLLKGKGRKQVSEIAASKDTQVSPKKQPESGKKNPGRGLKPAVDVPAKGDGQARSGNGKEKIPASKRPGDLQEDELIGCKIKVWWPLDRRFYKGAITGYDSKKKKHKILYDDGEVENLLLASEKWEILDSSKAAGKVTSEKTVTPAPSSNQSGKLKRKAPGQVDNGSQSSGPSDKKRAGTKVGTETNAQTLQEVGRGLAQAKIGSLTTPSPKNAKSSASIISAGPFAFDDEGPAGAIEGKKAKGSTRDASSKGAIMPIRVKRNTEAASKEKGEKQKEMAVEKAQVSKEVAKAGKSGAKPDSGKAKGNSEKKTKSESKVDNQNRKETVNSDIVKADRVESEKGKDRSQSTRGKEKGDAETSKAKVGGDKSPARVDGNAGQGDVGIEKPKTVASNDTNVKSDVGKGTVEKERTEKKVENEAEKQKAEPEKTILESSKETVIGKGEVEDLEDRVEPDKVNAVNGEKSAEESTELSTKTSTATDKKDGNEADKVEADVAESAKDSSTSEKDAPVLEISQKDASQSVEEIVGNEKNKSEKEDVESSVTKVAEESKPGVIGSKKEDDEPMGSSRSRRRKLN